MDAVTLSVLSAALAGIAEEMGTVLVRSSLSANIKERRDCSAALFEARGRMVAQAEHIPVHLGAMPESVAAVIARGPRPGDTYVLNDPFAGGSHLPDITLVTPLAHDGDVLAYACTRAHHSDVGGIVPGSMPAGSTSIWQEGVIVPPVRLDQEVLRVLLANVRTPEIRRGDLAAQASANRLAEERLNELVARQGLEAVLAAFDAVIAYSARRTREAIRRLPDGIYRARSEVEGDGVTDDDLPIEVAVAIADDEIEVDFAGTSPAAPGNVNAPFAVTRAACTFAVKVALGADVPVNAGLYDAVTIRAPEGCLVDARAPSAVVAGKVETSQRIADTVLLALAQAADVPAQGQGTMNNVVIGTPRWTYYETLGGGQGASAHGPGPSGVHVGMSNTLNTPIEALELETPLRVERYELLEGSGGAGRHRGGDGLVRAIRVLEPATLSLLTDRRRHAPRGLAGGRPGRLGRNLVDGEPVPPKTTRELEAGAVVTVETPGGGGWGV
ncbi:MAG TPA: hydantoinase B/oxoprolinase family protein [Gaiellaceae bacterium]|nr:hydantoinase B/oxoprolinase family protein [Gaiellaceae bacterium]